MAPVLAVPTAAAAAEVGGPTKFMPLQPDRILDTRSGTGAARQAVPAGGTVDLQILGVGGIPTAGVSAVVLNVTITGTSGTGHVSVYPTGTDGRATSVINHTALTPTIPGLVTAPVGTTGKVTIYTAKGGHLLADVFGYYTEVTSSDDGRFVPLAPSRTLDTRDGTGTPAPANPGDTVNCTDFTTWSAPNEYFWRYYPHYGDVARLDQDNDQVPCEGLSGAPQSAQKPAQPKPAAGASVELQVTGRNGVPAAGVAAVALNVTATQADKAGFVQVIPTGGTTAVAASSNLNLSARGQTIANLVIVPVGSGGQVTLYTSGGTHLIADVAGYYTDATAEVSDAGLFQAVTPQRELDTREQRSYYGTSGQRPATGSETRIDTTSRISVPSTGVAALVMNVAAVGAADAGFVQVFPTGRAMTGTSSNINFVRGQVIANAVLSPLGDQSQMSLYVSKSTHLIADVFGYFLAAGSTGTTPTNDTLTGLQIAPHNTTVPYSRAEWVHWIDDDSDCQNTRAETLWVESEITVQYDAAGCVVVSGQWTDPYTGKVWTAASDLDVDHTVALQNAHLSGGHAWDAARKQAYANDWMQPEHLNAIEDNLNAAKGASAPDAWKPPLQSAWCLYAMDWAEIKKRWDLTVTQSEYDALEDMLATC